MGFIDFLFDTSNWPPRWYCGHWTPALGWVHIVSDIAIFLAYVSIPAVLVYWCVKRRDIPFNYLLILFALFIVFCGSGHLVEAMIFWKPFYRFDGLVKLSTAIISWVTVISLLPVIPKVLEFPKLERLNEILNRDLITSRKRLELSFEGSDVGLWDWDIENNKMTFSTFFVQLIGNASDLPDKTFEEFLEYIHPEDRRTFQDSINQHLEKHAHFKARIRMLVKGKYRWFNMGGLAHWKENGKPARMAGSLTDIQDLIDAQLALSHTIHQLKDTNKEMEDFLYVVSHDLRAPLINIKGFSEELSVAFNSINPYVEKIKGTQSTDPTLMSYQEEVPQALNFICSSVRKIDNLIEGLLKLSRIGKSEFSPETVDTKKLVTEQIQALTHQIKSGQIEISVGDMPNVVGDPLALQQIFANLIDNAIKYSDPKRRNKIEIFGRKEQNCTRFFVKDTGIGIQQKDFQKIFQIFKRIDPLSTKGEGMGLSFIKALIKKHSGSIEFSSTFGQGTEFNFTVAHNLKAEEERNVAFATA